MKEALCKIKEFVGYGDCPKCGSYAVTLYSVKLKEVESKMCFYCYDARAEEIIVEQFRRDYESLNKYISSN